MAFDLSILGVKENVPRVSFLDYSGMLAGVPKIGKTTFASKYDNCILLACEKGYKAKKLNYKDITDWNDFKEFVSSLELNREEIGEDIKTIVIDTVDRLYPYVQEYTVKKYNRAKSANASRADSIGDIPHGKGWGDADKEFLCEITKIINLGFTFLFVTHNKIKTITPKDGLPYDVYYPTMPERCSAVIYPLVDFIINMQRVVIIENGEEVGKRELVLRSNTMASGGSRVGNVSEKIIFETEEEAITMFKDTFKKAILEELNKDGVVKDIDELEKSQKKEKDALVKESLVKTVELPNLIKEIKSIMKSKLKSNKIDNAFIVETLKVHEINNPDEIGSIETAKNIIGTLDKA